MKHPAIFIITALFVYWLVLNFLVITILLAVWKSQTMLLFLMWLGFYGVLYGLSRVAGKRFKTIAYLLALPVLFYVLLTRIFMGGLYDYFLLKSSKGKGEKSKK